MAPVGEHFSSAPGELSHRVHRETNVLIENTRVIGYLLFLLAFYYFEGGRAHSFSRFYFQVCFPRPVFDVSLSVGTIDAIKHLKKRVLLIVEFLTHPETSGRRSCVSPPCLTPLPVH